MKHRGQPVIVLAIILGGWIAVRLMLADPGVPVAGEGAPGPIIAAPVPDSAPASPAVTSGGVPWPSRGRSGEGAAVRVAATQEESPATGPRAASAEAPRVIARPVPQPVPVNTAEAHLELWMAAAAPAPEPTPAPTAETARSGGQNSAGF